MVKNAKVKIMIVIYPSVSIASSTFAKKLRSVHIQRNLDFWVSLNGYNVQQWINKVMCEGRG
jgi:hypothetical protein